MPAVKKYTRINFQNYPSTSTPLNATNLNKMDKGIDDLDDEVVAVKNTIENMSFDANAISYDNTQSGLQATDVQGAVDEINDNLAQTPITTSEGETLSTIDDKLNYLINRDVLVFGESIGGISALSSQPINLTSTKEYILFVTVYWNNFPARRQIVTYNIKNGQLIPIQQYATNYNITVSLSDNVLTIRNTESTYPVAYALVSV